MPLPISRSAADRLGTRLRRNDVVADSDVDLLLEIMQAYQRALDEVQARLRHLGRDPTSRTKTTQVLIEKLRRENSSLKSVQDIAGARIVEDCDRLQQDEIVADIVAAFQDGSRPPRVIDRRVEPTHGYRAVHVIVTVQELPVEIQVRTHMQDLWAQIAESLGDVWGRGIRYGQGPPDPDEPLGGTVLTRGRLWEFVQDLSERMDVLEELRVELELLEVEQRAILDRGVRTQEESDARFAGIQDLASIKERMLLAEEKLRGDLSSLAGWARRLAP